MSVMSERIRVATAKADELPHGWCVVRFEQMAENIAERVDNPAEAGVEHYVGLEHLDPDSLKIRRWGTPDEVEATKLRFKPGDIIFGRRRAYQRKLAVADFEGICSAHALVLRAREDIVVPEFLPFFMQCEAFSQRALEISVGSLSPTINWKTLAVQEFALPPKDEQRRIAEILWAAEDSIEFYATAQEEAWQALEALDTHVMQNGLNQADVATTEGIAHPARWPLKQLVEIAAVDRGKFAHRPRNLPEFYGGPYPFVQTGDVASSRGLLRAFDQTLSEKGKAVSRSFPPGAVLITIAAIIGKTAVTACEVWCPDSVVGIVPGQEVDARFLEFYLRTRRHYLDERAATQSAQKNINLSVLRPLLVPVPPIEEQLRVVSILANAHQQWEFIGGHIAILRETKHALLARLVIAEMLGH